MSQIMGLTLGKTDTSIIKVDKEQWFQMTDYEPHLGQQAVHDSDARFRTVVAGRRWGKSLAAAKEAEVMILTPGTRGWVVSKTYDLTQKVIREIRTDLLHRYRLKPSRSQVTGPIILEFPWGSVVEGKTAEHPDSLLGEGLDWLIFDECAKCKPSIWEQYLRPALTDNKGWALFITTPNGYNWVYDVWKRGNDPDHPDWESFKSPTWANPHLPADDIAEAQRTLSKAAFAQEYGADFTLSSGQVYKEFDETYHVIPYQDLKVDSSWQHFRSIDFGYENPFVCLYIAIDPEDRVIVYDEYYVRHRTVEEHGKQLNKDKREYEYTTCDPSGASARATLLENGIPTVAVRSSVLHGLEAVRQHLKHRKDGTPGLLVSSQCVNTIKEFNLYSYPETADKETPAKEYDHAMDALRYFISNWSRGYLTQRVGVYA